MSEEKKTVKAKEPEAPKEVTHCIGIVCKTDGSYEIKVFTLEENRVVKMEVIECQNKAYALEKFKIEAGSKILKKIVSI